MSHGKQQFILNGEGSNKIVSMNVLQIFADFFCFLFSCAYVESKWVQVKTRMYLFVSSIICTNIFLSVCAFPIYEVLHDPSIATSKSRLEQILIHCLTPQSSGGLRRSGVLSPWCMHVAWMGDYFDSSFFRFRTSARLLPRRQITWTGDASCWRSPGPSPPPLRLSCWTHCNTSETWTRKALALSHGNSTTG